MQRPEQKYQRKLANKSKDVYHKSSPEAKYFTVDMSHRMALVNFDQDYKLIDQMAVVVFRYQSGLIWSVCKY